MNKPLHVPSSIYSAPCASPTTIIPFSLTTGLNLTNLHSSSLSTIWLCASLVQNTSASCRPFTDMPASFLFPAVTNMLYNFSILACPFTKSCHIKSVSKPFFDLICSHHLWHSLQFWYTRDMYFSIYGSIIYIQLWEIWTIFLLWKLDTSLALAPLVVKSTIFSFPVTQDHSSLTDPWWISPILLAAKVLKPYDVRPITAFAILLSTKWNTFSNLKSISLSTNSFNLLLNTAPYWPPLFVSVFGPEMTQCDWRWWGWQAFVFHGTARVFFEREGKQPG